MAEVFTPPAFDDVATSELVTAAQLNAFGNSLRFLREVDYVQFTSNVTISATTDATANTVVTGSTLTFEAVPHLIIFSAVLQIGANAGAGVVLNLYEDGADIGRLGTTTNSAASTLRVPVHRERRYTPTAASHTFSIRAWRVTSDGSVLAGAGTAGTDPAGYIRIVRVPT